MTDRLSYWRRALGLFVCYVLALQAFLAAYGTAFAVSRGPAFDGVVICHGAGDIAPSSDGTTPAEKLPCAVCAVAAAGGGLIPDLAVTIAPSLAAAASIGIAGTIEIRVTPSPRAGLSRAPPSFA